MARLFRLGVLPFDAAVWWFRYGKSKRLSRVLRSFIPEDWRGVIRKLMLGVGARDEFRFFFFEVNRWV